MPKRAPSEKYERYLKKINKFEADMKKTFGAILGSDGEEDDEIEMLLTAQEARSDDEVLPTGETSFTIFEITQGGQPQAGAVPGPSMASMDHGEIVEPDILSALDELILNSPEFEPPIDDHLTKIWSPILKKGLKKEDKDQIMKSYLVPKDCKLLHAPKLKAGCAEVLSQNVREQDNKLRAYQKQLGTGLMALNRSLKALLTGNDKTQAIKYASDAGLIVSDLHFHLAIDRVDLVTADFDDIAFIQEDESDTAYSGSLLAEEIAAIEASKPIASPIITINGKPMLP